MQKFGQGLARSLCEAQFTQPGGVVGEIDVGGDVLAARIGIDVGSGESLMQEISTQRAVWPPMVEPGEFVAVVDGEHGAAFPMRCPLVQPVAYAGVKLTALAVGEGGVTQDAVVGGIESMRMQLLRHPDLQPALLGGAPLHQGGGEGVEEFVVVDERVALRSGEVDPAQVADSEAKVDAAAARCEDRLADGRDFLMGAFSIADLVTYSWLAGMELIRPAAFAETPLTRAWLARVAARPSILAALAMANTPEPLRTWAPGPEINRWG